LAIRRVLLDNINDFYKLDFIESDKKIKAICSDPTRADNISHLVSHRSIEPITIAQFVKEIIKKNLPDQKVYRKSELFLELSVIWKKAGGKKVFNSFNQAFNLFTDYRGFTSDIELIEEVLPEHPEELALALKWFYAYMTIQNILEEQAAYKKCAEIISDGDSLNESFIFVGFSHFSALQLELLSSLGAKSDIYIPSFREIEDDLISTDWAYWLDTMGAEKIELEKRNFELKAEVFTFPKGYLSEVIKKDSSSKNILIFDKTPNLKEYLELDTQQSFYKVSVDLFEMYFEELEKESWDDDNISKRMSSLVKNKDFIRLKLYLSLKESITSWKEISDENRVPSEFDRKIIFEILKLNLPRSSALPVGLSEWGSNLFDLSRVETLDLNQDLSVCVKNNGISLSSSNEIFTEKVKSFLVALGPLRNIKRERSQLQCYVKGLLIKNKVKFFIEEGTLDENLFWDELEIDNVKKYQLYPSEEKPDFLNDKIKRKEIDILKYSASRLQTFIDCPRKYYFSYVDNLDIQKSYLSKFTASEMGLMLHEIIEKKELNEKLSLTEIVSEIMNKYAKSKQVNPLYYEDSRLKLLYKSKNAEVFLNELKRIDPNIDLVFEKVLTGDCISGRIDLIWDSAILGKGIVDFKSSAYGIPSKIEHTEFRKIQLWFYLNYCGFNLSEINYWGFLNLDDLSKSLMFARSESKLALFKSNIVTDLSLSDFQSFEEALVAQIKNESQYLAKPSNQSACNFCHVSNLCPKGELNG
jgi:hypothetical protein